MIALAADDTRQFMNRLLRSDMADNFLLSSLEMDLDYRLSIDCGGFEAPVPWSRIRPLVVEHLKASGQPGPLKLVLALSPDATGRILERFPELVPMVSGFTLTILYNGQQARATTGVNYAAFTLDKAAEQAFDTMIRTFFHKNGCAMTS